MSLNEDILSIYKGDKTSLSDCKLLNKQLLNNIDRHGFKELVTALRSESINYYDKKHFGIARKTIRKLNMIHNLYYEMKKTMEFAHE